MNNMPVVKDLLQFLQCSSALHQNNTLLPLRSGRFTLDDLADAKRLAKKLSAAPV